MLSIAQGLIKTRERENSEVRMPSHITPTEEQQTLETTIPNYVHNDDGGKVTT